MTTIDDVKASLEQWEAQRARLAKECPAPSERGTPAYDLWRTADNEAGQRIRNLRDTLMALYYEAGDWRHVGPGRHFDWLFAKQIGMVVLEGNTDHVLAAYGGYYREDSTVRAVDKNDVPYYSTKDAERLLEYLPKGDCPVEIVRELDHKWWARIGQSDATSHYFGHALGMAILAFREAHREDIS